MKKSVYVLTGVRPHVQPDERKGHYVQMPDGSVRCNYEKIGVFSSVRKAEDTIMHLVKQEEKSPYKTWYPTYFGFILDENYLDDALYGEYEWENISEFESRRTYLPDGRLNCYSDVDDRCEKPFAGRKDPITHVKPGGYALECSHNRIMPILLDCNALTAEEWKTRFKNGTTGDATDDAGIAFTAERGHCHPFSPMVFPLSCLPHLKLEKRLLRKMELARREYYGEGKL